MNDDGRYVDSEWSSRVSEFPFLFLLLSFHFRSLDLSFPPGFLLYGILVMHTYIPLSIHFIISMSNLHCWARTTEFPITK